MKRILSLILSLVLVFGILPCLGVSAEEEAMTETERVIEQLRDIGILQGDERGEIEPAATLSRAEFVTLIARVLNMEHNYDGVENDLFVDVPQNYWAKSAILACAKAGYIVGTDDGIFSPEDNVSMEQAVKIMVKVLGYEYLAQENGGYPTGHIYVATRLEILDSITTAKDEPLTMGDAAHLFFNSLEVILTEEAGYSGESVFYSNSAKNTLLGKYLGLARAEAKVDAIYGMSLTDQEVENQNQIIIDGVIYEYSGADPRALLGRTVEYFYTIGEKQLKSAVKSVMPAKEMNSEVTIPLKDLIDAQKGLITYEDANEDEKKVTISPEIKYVYNFELLMDYDIEDLKTIQTGMITLVDNNDDRTYDIGFIYDYTTYIVETKTSKSIQGKNNTAVIDLEKKNRVIYLNYYDGREVALSKVKAGHILSVIQTDKILEMKINDLNVTGVYESSGNGTVMVNGIEYDVAKDMYAPNVKLGDQASVYFNAFNQVAYMDSTVTTTLKVGYLARMVETEGAFSSGLRVKLLADTGELQILPIAERMILNENYYTVRKDKNLILAALGYTADMNIEPQLVKYALNAAGEVCELHLAADYLNADEDGFVMAIGEDTVDESTGKISKQGVSMTYYTSYGVVRSGVAVARPNTKSTKAFIVPTWEKIGSADAEDFIVMSPSDLVNSSTYNMKLYYNSKKNALVDYIVIHHENPRGSKRISYSNVGGVFLDSISVWEDGEAKPAIEYFNGKETVTVTVADYAADKVPALKKGDAIRLTSNWKGEADSVQRIYAQATGETVSVTPTLEFGMGVGYIVFEKDDYVRISTTEQIVNDSHILSENLYPKTATNTIVVEERNGEILVSKGSANDLTIGTKVCYIVKYGSASFYIVYK